MFNVGDYLVCRRDVYGVMQIKEKHYNDTDYYVLNQVDDMSLKMEIPVNSDKIRALLDTSEVEEIINEIPNVLKMEILNDYDKSIEAGYKKLLDTGTHEDLIKVIKTSYLRNKEKLDDNKKTSAIDEKYLNLAEKYLYGEISVVLDLSYDDVKKIVRDKVTEVNN